MSLKRFSDIIDFQTLEPVDLLNAMFAVADQEQDEEKVHAAIQRIKELLPSDQPIEEEKAVLSKKALRKKSPLPMAAALKRFFAKQKAELLGKVKAVEAKAFPPDNWFDVEDWTKAMAEAMRPVVALYYDHAAKQTAARIGGSLDLLKVSQPKLQEGIDRATFLFCKETNETTSQELGAAVKGLKDSLAEGLEIGEVQNELTKRVQTIFDQAEVGRAYRIAVTEASRGQHSAQEIVAQESGLVKGKRWILSSDACDLCKPLAGKVVGLGESFTTLPTGGPYAEVQYPPLHPQCRCDLIEIIQGVND